MYKLEKLLGVRLTEPKKSTEENPPEPGVYLASVSKEGMFFRRWDGKDWHYGDTDQYAAARIDRKWPKAAPLWWQGLADDPAKVGQDAVRS